jgi:DNA-directed RNA polymerase subunit RPC12/RpoP
MECITAILPRVLEQLREGCGDDMQIVCSNCGKVIVWDKSTAKTRYELCKHCKEKVSK